MSSIPGAMKDSGYSLAYSAHGRHDAPDGKLEGQRSAAVSDCRALIRPSRWTVRSRRSKCDSSADVARAETAPACGWAARPGPAQLTAEDAADQGQGLGLDGGTLRCSRHKPALDEVEADRSVGSSSPMAAPAPHRAHWSRMGATLQRQQLPIEAATSKGGRSADSLSVRRAPVSMRYRAALGSPSWATWSTASTRARRRSCDRDPLGSTGSGRASRPGRRRPDPALVQEEADVKRGSSRRRTCSWSCEPPWPLRAPCPAAVMNTTMRSASPSLWVRSTTPHRDKGSLRCGRCLSVRAQGPLRPEAREDAFR